MVRSHFSGDFEGVFDGVGGEGFKFAHHFVVFFEVELAGFVLHAFGVFDVGAGLDADENIVGIGVFGAEVVAVVGGDHFDVH